MGFISSSLSERYGRLTDNHFRIIYSIIVVLTLGSIAFAAIRILSDNLVNSDDTLWAMKKLDGRTALVVDSVLKGGGAEKAGVRKGDEVLAINDVPITNPDPNAAQIILNHAPTDREIPYVVRREGREIHLKIRLTAQLIFVRAVIPLVALLWLVIGAMVAFARPQGVVQRRFFLTGALMLFAFVSPARLQGEGISEQILAYVWGFLSIIFYPLWLHFCTIFPVDQRIFNTRGRRFALYSIVWAYLLLTGARFLLSWFYTSGQISRPTAIIIYQIIGATFVIGAALYFIAGIWFLFRAYRRMPGSSSRRPMRVLLAGAVLAGLTYAYFAVVQTGNLGLTLVVNPYLLLPMLLLLALPISFAYGIFFYQLMDFRMVVQTTLVYTATMAVIGALTLGVAYGFGNVLGSLTGESMETTVTWIAVVVFLLLFEPIKWQVQTTIENRFFPQYRDFTDQIAAYSEQISETVGTRAVAELMAFTLKHGLQLRGVYVLVEPREKELELLAKATDFPPLEVQYASIMRLRGLLHEAHDIISLETVNDPAVASIQEWFSYVVGLFAQGRVIGMVLLTRPADGAALSGRQLQFISGVARQGAGAIEAARLYGEELERQRYREELATARRIQESLLPSAMPKFPGVSICAMARSAQAVGGDYHDVITLEDGRFLVIIADVSGKGLPASLYMAEFHGMVRIASATRGTPKEILSMLNDHLSSIIARGSFITATMLLFDTRRKSVGMARAGHTPIIRRQGSGVDTLIPGGIALGLGSHAIFTQSLQEYTVHYEPGETFILYSDGVSEAMNASRDEFGEGRLMDVVSSLSDDGADAICGGIARRVDEFRGGAEQNDDVTIVVIRIEKEVGETTEAARSVPARSR